jgi:hypothetical protein
VFREPARSDGGLEEVRVKKASLIQKPRTLKKWKNLARRFVLAELDSKPAPLKSTRVRHPARLKLSKSMVFGQTLKLRSPKEMENLARRFVLGSWTLNPHP